VVALARDFHLVSPCFLTGLTAIFVAGLDHAAAGQVCTPVLFICCFHWFPFLKSTFLGFGFSRRFARDFDRRVVCYLTGLLLNFSNFSLDSVGLLWRNAIGRQVGISQLSLFGL
jgi:hypothetical protein